MIFTVQVNFEVEIEADNFDEADGIARSWEPNHPQYRKYSDVIKPEYVVVIEEGEINKLNASVAQRSRA